MKKLRYLFTLGAVSLLAIACGDEDATETNNNNGNNVEAPTVTETVPDNNDVNIPRNVVLSATFSETMNPSSLAESSFTLKQGSTTVPTVLTYTGKKATLTPVEILDGETIYTATISTAVTSERGKTLANPFTWSFTTADSTAPTIVSRSPENNAMGVERDAVITVEFSEEMSPSSLLENSFVLTEGTTEVSAEITYTGLIATLTPAQPLNPDTVYTATVTSGLMSLTGFALTNPGSWTFTTLDDVSPQVDLTYPANNDVDVLRNVEVRVNFNEAMDPASLTATSFVLEQGNVAVPAILSYENRVATLKAIEALDAETVYTVTLNTDVKSALGNPLASEYSWTFTTNMDTLPSILTTFPANNDINVPRNAVVTATFSEAMSPTSLSESSFTLKAGNDTIAGSLTYTGLIATFEPDEFLEEDTLYTATITTEVESLTGYSLEDSSEWSFRTTASANGPNAVNLGSAEQFVMLAKAAISTTGATSIVGDVGLSPADITYLTGFSQLMPPTSFTTSALVTGQIFAADFDAPTPSILTTAVSDMETAYTDAASRTLPDFTELGAGNIDGMTLVPGLYKWGTGVTIPTGVTLMGSDTDIWIFQIAQDLDLGNAAIVTLLGGAKPENVFWQVAGQITLGTTSQMKGILLCQTLIEVKTGASVLGRLYAQTAITMEANAIAQP